MDQEAREKTMAAGRAASAAREAGIREAREGMDLMDLALLVEGEIASRGAEPAFPVNLGLNSVAAHFTPVRKGEHKLRAGDLLKIDVGAHVDGYLADTAGTVHVGFGTGHPLIRASAAALAVAMTKVLPGAPVEPVGAAVEESIRAAGFKPIENLTGHLMRRNRLHAGLSVPNVGGATSERFPAEGLVAVEPFATTGAGRVVAGEDGNIFLFQKTPVSKDQHTEAATAIKARHPHLPFTPRWLGSASVDSAIPALLRKGCIRSYPVLRDAAGGLVSQHEHTLLFHEGKAIATTL